MITSLAIGATMTSIFALLIFIGAVAVAFDTRESPKIKFGGLKLAVISTIACSVLSGCAVWLWQRALA